MRSRASAVEVLAGRRQRFGNDDDWLAVDTTYTTVNDAFGRVLRIPPTRRGGDLHAQLRDDAVR
jgi:pyruvate carboxylase